MLQWSRPQQRTETQTQKWRRLRRQLASMEPSSAEDGDAGTDHRPDPGQLGFNGAVLSRGRRPVCSSLGDDRRRSFNGAVLSRGRRPERGGSGLSTALASMEPSSAEDGDTTGMTSATQRQAASMEPSSAEDGDQERWAEEIEQQQLQWSRPQQRTETGRFTGADCKIQPRFNGAVLSRGRRPPRTQKA